MKGGTQGFPRHEVSDKQEVLFENVSPSMAFSIRQLLLKVRKYETAVRKKQKKKLCKDTKI